ncbi:MAG: UbiD family decarboxylase [Candidatus Thermoplasmatota archaeon]|nr:UbiD family decarboxylase [Candidatus Thermoplasmatota archaeon]
MSLKQDLKLFPDAHIVKKSVGLELEVTHILREDEEQVVYFSDLAGFPAVGNLWSTRERVCEALGISREKLPFAILEAIHHPMKEKLTRETDFLPGEVKGFDLRRDLPAPQWYPKEPGRYLTSAIVAAEWDGKRNLSYHRMLILDERRLVARLVPRHLRAMMDAALDRGKEIHVGIFIGAPLPVLLAGAMSLEYDSDELRIAASLTRATTGKALDAVQLGNGILVPSDCEYVMEGRITGELHEEGPFVDGTGTYDKVRMEPVFEVERLYRRPEAVYHLILSGGMEHHTLMGMPREPLIYEAVRRVVPHVQSVRLTEGGSSWLHGVVAIRKQHEGDGKNAIMAALTGHTSMKMVTIVDEDIDIYDDRDVEWAVATRFQADRDLVLIHSAKGSSIDPSAGATTSKMGLDATKTLGHTEFDKPTL